MSYLLGLGRLVLLASAAHILVAQQARWLQLNNAEVRLINAGKYQEALPAAQEALRVAEATFGPQDPKTAKSLENLALVLDGLKQTAQAEQLYRRALDINLKALGPVHLEVARNLQYLGTMYQKAGRQADAAEILGKSIAIYEKTAGPDDVGFATCAGYLALVYDQQRRYAGAEKLDRLALAIDEKALGPENPSVVIDLTNLGAVLRHESKFGEAEALYVRVLSIDLKLHGKDDPAIAADLRELASVYADTRKFAKAEPIYRRAIEIDEKALGPNHPTVAMDFGSLGNLYQRQGRDAEATPLYRKSLAIREQALGPADPQVALALSNLAEALFGQGQYAEAESSYRRAIDIDVKALGPEHPEVAQLLTKLARVYMEEIKVPAALPLFERALAIHQKIPDYQADVARDLSGLAEIYMSSGRPADAISTLRRALEIHQKLSGPNSIDAAIVMMTLGDFLRRQGSLTDAESLQERALPIVEKEFGPDDPATRECVLSLAMTYSALNLPEKATPYFDRSINTLAKQFDSSFAYMSESERLRFLGTLPGAFPIYFSYVTEFRKRDPSLTGKMYDLLLWEKGLIAVSAGTMRAKIVASKDPQALALFDRLTAMKAQVAAAASGQGDRNALAQWEQQANDVEKELLKRSSALADQKSRARARWQDVRKTLKPGEAAVEIVRFQALTGKLQTAILYYVALVLTPDAETPKLVVLGEAEKLEAAPLTSYRTEVARTRGTAARTAKQRVSAEPSPEAYNAFWKPLEAEIGDAKRVYVSTDGVLSQIPVGLFSDTTGKLLMEKYDLRVVSSTRDLLLVPQTALSKIAVLIGNPAFDLSEPEHRAALDRLQTGGPPHPPATREARPGQLPPLPATQDEVEAVARALKSAGWQVMPFTGDLALEEVLDGLRGPRVLHLATHGFFLPDPATRQRKFVVSAPSGTEEPMLRSGLFFAGADRARSGAPRAKGIDDGVLTAYQTAQLNLAGTELVVLSACETGLGEQKNGEGVFGLPRGLQEAGAESVLMSMWSVPDRETQELMTLFYQKWLAGADKHEALRQAQLQERETVRQRYGADLPYYWGAFVLIGR